MNSNWANQWANKRRGKERRGKERREEKEQGEGERYNITYNIFILKLILHDT